MFRFIILILTSLLLFSCQNDDTPDLALITIEASESLYSAPDQIWRVSISDLGGNIMDTRPLVIGGTTELGAFINKKERPEKVHVHIIRENLIPDRESYFIETFSEVNIGSSIVYNNSGKGTGFRTVKATANLSNVTNPISLQRNHSIVSAGINWVNSFNEDLNNLVNTPGASFVIRVRHSVCILLSEKRQALKLIFGISQMVFKKTTRLD